MARTALTAKTPVGAYGSYSANAADLTMTAADTSDQNSCVASGNDLIIAHNTDSGAHNITITSVANEKGRSGDISSYSLGAGEYAIFGPFLLPGWEQTDGSLYFEADDATVKFGVVALG